MTEIGLVFPLKCPNQLTIPNYLAALLLLLERKPLLLGILSDLVNTLLFMPIIIIITLCL